MPPQEHHLPALLERVEVVDHPPPGEIPCPLCGSSFHPEGRAITGASFVLASAIWASSSF
jgi:hypothetical protein